MNGSVDLASGRRRDVWPQSATSQVDYRYDSSVKLASSRRLPEMSDLDIITPSQRNLNLSSHGYDDEPVINQREPILNRPTHQSTYRYEDGPQTNHRYDVCSPDRVPVEPEPTMKRSINRSTSRSTNVPDYVPQPNRLIVNSTRRNTDEPLMSRPINRSTNRSTYLPDTLQQTNRSINRYDDRSPEPYVRRRLPRTSFYSDDEHEASGNVDVARMTYHKRALPTIKLETYNGNTPLEKFLVKLKNCSEYYQWSSKETLCHLKASLDGHAGQVL